MPVGEGKVADDRLEARVDRVEARDEAIHGEVRREHRAADAEEIDGSQDHLAVRLYGPGPPGHAEPGDLDGDVRLGGERRHRIPPAAETLRAAVGRQARMVEDHQGVGECARESRGLTQVPPGSLEIEGETVACESRVSRAPAWIPHRARGTLGDRAGRRRGLRLVTDTADERASGLAGEDRLDVVPVEPRLGDHGAREPLLDGQFLHPARLADGVHRIPLGFHVDRADDPVVSRVRPVVGGQVVAPERPRVAVAEGRRRLVPEPGMPPERQIPEVLVSVDDGQVVRVGQHVPGTSHGMSSKWLWGITL